jgi:hypothetical protein
VSNLDHASIRETPGNTGDTPELPMRRIGIQVPTTMTDEQVSLALQIGVRVSQLLTQGLLPIVIPAAGNAGHASIQVLGVLLKDDSDLKRLMHVATVINDTNTALLKAAQQRPVDAIALTVSAGKAKDQAVRDVTAAHESRPSIIVP